jgi:hypothetical protein
VLNKSFGSFVDKKKRESIRQLELMKKILEQNNFKVRDFLNEQDSDPYIFCYNPLKDSSFEGIRIYKIGNELAFRIQKESQTHPYGSAYPLPVESMFNDFLTDNTDEDEVSKQLVEAIGKEINNFFEKSSKAEESSRKLSYNKDSVGSVLVRSTGTDYASLIYNKN